MSVTNLTGNDARFQFGTFEWIVRSIAEWGYERLAIPDSNLLTNSFATSIPSDLYVLDPITLELAFSVTEVEYRHTPELASTTAVLETKLIFPPGAVTNAWQLRGNAFCVRWGLPMMDNNERQISTATFQFDGTEGSNRTNVGPVWEQVT